ncbi:MAG: hypothetical protein ABI901_18545, partial [Roseiflexaceae bacterium]
MPTKKDLAALLSETPQQPLRRGRGLRLSRASKQALELAAKPVAAPELAADPAPSAAPALSAAPDLALVEPTVAADESAVPPIAADSSAAEAVAIAGAPREATASSDLAPPTPERDKRKLLLRKDLLKQCKRLARAQGRKLYQVV